MNGLYSPVIMSSNYVIKRKKSFFYFFFVGRGLNRKTYFTFRLLDVHIDRRPSRYTLLSSIKDPIG